MISRAFLCVVVAWQLLIMPASLAQGIESTNNVSPVNLDLASTDKSLLPGHLVDVHSVDILVGNTLQTITPGTLLTPAERLAVYQVFSTGQQSILLSSLGNAVGGSFTMGPNFSKYVSGVVIPAGVTAVKDFATATTLSLAGNLSNAGSFFAVSSNSAVTTAVINASNIFNQQGALLTTVLPTGGLPGWANTVSNLNLQLSAIKDIVNSGVISSAGNLTASAGGSIINALPAGATGPSPVMQAANNLNLMSAVGNIVNSGIIASAAGNINLASAMSSALCVTNISGQLQALNGAINLRSADYLGNNLLSLTGGEFLSRELNLFADRGNLTVEIEKATGVINATGNNVRVNVNSGDARVGNVLAYGDPVFAVDTYTLSGDVTTGGASLSIIAHQNILDDGSPHIISTSSTTAGGDILLAAGAAWTNPAPGTTYTFSGGTLEGGYINLSHVRSIDSRGGTGTIADYNGGNVTLVAYAGTGTDSGTISFPGNIYSGGSQGGASGEVIIIAGADGPGAANSITVGSINAASVNGVSGGYAVGTGPGGNIFIATAIPGGTVDVDATTGAILTNTLTADAIRNASVQTGILTTCNGAALTILSGNNITTNTDYILSAPGYTGSNGSITLAAGIVSQGGITVEATAPSMGGTVTVDDWKPWYGLGVTTPADTPGFTVGKDLIAQYKLGGDTDPYALSDANSALRSSTGVPLELRVPAGTVFYKLVPQGRTPSAKTSYWMTYDQLQAILADPDQIANMFALPPSTAYAAAYDVYSISANTATQVFSSPIAATSNTATGVLQDGGGTQTIVPNRLVWATPVFVQTVTVPATFERSASVFSSGNVSLFASGDVSVSGDTGHSGIFGNNVTICAGCIPVFNAIANTVSVSSAASSSGGQINIFSNPGAYGPVSGWGGNVTLVALYGSNASSGTITVGNTSSTMPSSINTFDTSPSSALGNVLVLANAANVSGGNAIITGIINACGGSATRSTNINLATTNSLGDASLDLTTGSLTSNYSIDITLTSFTNASIQTDTLTTSDGSNITILSGNNILTGAEYVLTAQTYSGTNGFISLVAGIVPGNTSGCITIGSAVGSVGTYETWHTLGVTTPADTPGFAIGADLIAQFKLGGDTDPYALSDANGALNSGVAVATEEIVPAGTVLYKLVPHNMPPSSTTAYWNTGAAASGLLADPSQIYNGQALPPRSYTSSYDLYAITAKAPATVFKSYTAPSIITDSGLYEDGGSEQTIVPNRNAAIWGPAQYVMTVPQTTQFVRGNSLYSAGTISLLASGSINIGGNTGSQSAVFGNTVLMCAGCIPAIAGAGVTVSSSASPSGGQINIFTNPRTSGPVASVGGQLSLLALYGSATPAAYAGTITIGNPFSSVVSSLDTFDTYRSGAPLSNSDILVLADAANLSGANALLLANVFANAGNPSRYSSICLATAVPTGGATVSLTTGGITSTFAADVSAVRPTSVLTGSIVTSGGNLTILAGKNIWVNNNAISASQTSGNGNGGSISLVARSGNITSGGIVSRGYGSTGSTGSIALTAGGNLTTGSIIGDNIVLTANSMIGSSIVLTASGNITVSPDMSLAATAGYIVLQSLDTTGGSIEIGGSDVLLGAGVYLVIGSIPVTPIQGTVPANVFVGTSNGGQVYFGARGISANPPTNAVVANRGTVVFDSGLLPGALIQLDGNVTIMANYVPPAPQQYSGAVSPVSFVLPHFSSNLGATEIVATDETNPGSLSLLLAPCQGQVEVTQVATGGATSTGAICQAGDFTTSVIADLSTQGVLAGADTSGNLISVTAGKALFAPCKDIIICVLTTQVRVAAGSVVYVSVDGQNAVIYNLHDQHAGDVQLRVDKYFVNLGMGKSAALTTQDTCKFENAAPNEAVSYRHPVRNKINDRTTLFLAEFSMVSALGNVPLIRTLSKSSNPENIRLLKQLYKDAAVLAMMNYSSGVYTGRKSQTAP